MGAALSNRPAEVRRSRSSFTRLMGRRGKYDRCAAQYCLTQLGFSAHAAAGVDPRQTSSGPAPAGTHVRQRGAYSRIRIVLTFCVAACAAGE
jgi:hypothetical protein